MWSIRIFLNKENILSNVSEKDHIEIYFLLIVPVFVKINNTGRKKFMKHQTKQ